MPQQHSFFGLVDPVVGDCRDNDNDENLGNHQVWIPEILIRLHIDRIRKMLVSEDILCRAFQLYLDPGRSIS